MNALWVTVFIAGNLAAILASNVGIRLSAWAPNWRGFLAWQIFGNLTGFVGVLCFTALMRYVPLNVGLGVTAGLGFVLVQVVGARFYFHEPISTAQWLGTSLVALGIILIAFGSKA